MDNRRVGTVSTDEMEILHRGKIVGLLYSPFYYMSIKIQPQLENLFYFFATTCSIRRTAQDVG